MTGDIVEALACVDRVFPGSRVQWWRRPPGKWVRP